MCMCVYARERERERREKGTRGKEGRLRLETEIPRRPMEEPGPTLNSRKYVWSL